MMPELAATLGFASGLLVGYVISQIREASIDVELAREFWRGGAGLEETSPSSKGFTNHETRDTNHGFLRRLS